MVRRAYSYLRISTDQQQRGAGIMRQLDASRAYADRHGYDLVDDLRDIGVSAFRGKNVNEGALGAFIAAIDAGQIPTGSILLIESLDRLSRDNVLTAFSQFSNILTKGIDIVTLTDEQHYSGETTGQNVGQLFTSIGIMLRANEESEIKSRRIGDAWKRKQSNAATTKLTAILPAWAYLSDDRTSILLDESKAAIVRKIFQLCIDGMGIYSITRHLNENPKLYPPISSARKWHDSYIAKILKNRATIGEYQAHSRASGKREPVGDPVANYYPPVIDENTFNLAQSKMQARFKAGRGRKGETMSNLFSSLLSCGSCNGPVLMRSKGKPPKGFKYVRCSNSQMGANCNCPAWRYDAFEAAFLGFVREIDFGEVFSSEDSGNQKQAIEAQAASARTQMAKLQTAYRNLLVRFESDNLPETLLNDLIARSKELQDEIEGTNKTIQEYEQTLAELSRQNVEGDQREFLEQYAATKKTNDAGQLREARIKMNAILRASIDEIIVYNDFKINPWEANDVISAKLRQTLAKRGIKTETQIEKHFEKVTARREYVDDEKYFLVRFKNGVRRIVTSRGSILTVDERLKKLRRKTRATN